MSNVVKLRSRRRNWYHDALMESYYSARDAQRAEAEAYSNGHATELEEFYRINKKVLFRDWLREFPASLGYYSEEAMAA